MHSIPQQYTSQITDLLIRMQTPTNTPDTMPEPEYDRIIAALSHILSTDKFSAAPQMSAFLRYVVEQTASGNKKRIKAYTVAVDALGKSDDFDPQNDPVVRVLAGRLRSSLTAYYEANPKVDVVIQMTTGTYVPDFAFHRDDIDDPVQIKKDSKSSGKVVSIPSAQSKAWESALPTEHLPDGESTKNGNTTEPCGEENPASSAETTPSVADKLQSAQRQNRISTTDRANDYPAPSPYKLAIAASVAVIALLLVYTYKPSTPQAEPALLTGLPVEQQALALLPERVRPDRLSVFISALGPDDSLESQLNTLISGVFSESEDLRVYRILHSNQHIKYWPEDYLVSINVVPSSKETQVNIQLIEAQSGHIGFSNTLSLDKTASSGLSSDDLTAIMSFARQLVSPDGPMMTDYLSKQTTTNKAEL